MSGHDWKVLAAFGLLLGGISLYDAGFATKLGGVAVIVILVRNANKIPLTTGGSSSPARPGTSSPAVKPAGSMDTSPRGSSTIYV